MAYPLSVSTDDDLHTCCHQDKAQPGCVMEEEGSLRVLLSLTAGRPLVFQEQEGKPLPKAKQLIHRHEGAGLTLTLDMAVGRVLGRVAKGARKMRAKG